MRIVAPKISLSSLTFKYDTETFTIFKDKLHRGNKKSLNLDAKPQFQSMICIKSKSDLKIHI